LRPILKKPITKKGTGGVAQDEGHDLTPHNPKKKKKKKKGKHNTKNGKNI
jgi:hypothetical protein